MPYRLTQAEFERLVENLLAGFPAYYRRHWKNLAFVVEPHGPTPDLLGLFEGTPVPEQSLSDPLRMPCRIRIFQYPHQAMSNSQTELAQNVLDTLWHEIGHYFGLTELEIARQERKRQRFRQLRKSLQGPR